MGIRADDKDLEFSSPVYCGRMSNNDKDDSQPQRLVVLYLEVDFMDRLMPNTIPLSPRRIFLLMSAAYFSISRGASRLYNQSVYRCEKYDIRS